jgi:hypothetical protein
MRVDVGKQQIPIPISLPLRCAPAGILVAVGDEVFLGQLERFVGLLLPLGVFA